MASRRRCWSTRGCDEWYAEPYYYVTPWPYPSAPSLPALAAGGSWHTEKWFGAALPASRFTGARAGERQAEQVVAFIDSAGSAAHALAG